MCWWFVGVSSEEKVALRGADIEEAGRKRQASRGQVSRERHG